MARNGATIQYVQDFVSTSACSAGDWHARAWPARQLHCIARGKIMPLHVSKDSAEERVLGETTHTCAAELGMRGTTTVRTIYTYTLADRTHFHAASIIMLRDIVPRTSAN